MTSSTVAELLRRTDVPVVAGDRDGLVTSLNEPFREAYGWAPGDLVGRPLTTIIPPRFHDAHHLGFSRFLATGHPTILGQPLPLNVMTKDGREFPAEHYIVAEQVGGAWTANLCS